VQELVLQGENKTLQRFKKEWGLNPITKTDFPQKETASRIGQASRRKGGKNQPPEIWGSIIALRKKKSLGTDREGKGGKKTGGRQ